MANKILIVLEEYAVTPERLARVRALAPQMRIVSTTDRAQMEAAAPDVEILVGHPPRDLLPSLPNLRWYQQWHAGTDWLLDHPQIAQQNFTLTNASGVHAVPISEHIFALILGLGRAIDDCVRAQSRGEWIRVRHRDIFELAGKTLLLVGVGAVGERTARLAQAFGMRVLGVRRHPQKDSQFVDEMHGTNALAELLPQADFLVLTIPYTRETEGLIGREELAQMKPSAVLVNIGRGKTIDEPALVEALQTGRLAGAGLDVFATEPLPSDSPLWQMDNVIVTPHFAGLTPVYDERAWGLFLENLTRYVQRRQLHNIVDKSIGY